MLGCIFRFVVRTSHVFTNCAGQRTWSIRCERLVAVATPGAIGAFEEYSLIEGLPPIFACREPQLAHIFLRRDWIVADAIIFAVALWLPGVESIKHSFVASGVQDWVL